MPHEIPIGKWAHAEAQRTGLTRRAIFSRYYRGDYPGLVVRRENQRVVLVTVPGDPPAPPPLRLCECGQPAKKNVAKENICQRCITARADGTRAETQTRRRYRVRQEPMLSSPAYYDHDDYRPVTGGSLAILEARLAAC